MSRVKHRVFSSTVHIYRRRRKDSLQYVGVTGARLQYLKSHNEFSTFSKPSVEQGMGGTVAQWVALLPHSNIQGLTQVLSVWSLHVLLVFAWVSSGCPGFLPPSKTCMLGLILPTAPSVCIGWVKCTLLWIKASDK